MLTCARVCKFTFLYIIFLAYIGVYCTSLCYIVQQCWGGSTVVGEWSWPKHVYRCMLLHAYCSINFLQVQICYTNTITEWIFPTYLCCQDWLKGDTSITLTVVIIWWWKNWCVKSWKCEFSTPMHAHHLFNFLYKILSYDTKNTMFLQTLRLIKHAYYCYLLTIYTLEYNTLKC